MEYFTIPKSLSNHLRASGINVYIQKDIRHSVSIMYSEINNVDTSYIV